MSAERLSSTLALEDRVGRVQGVSATRAAALSKLGIGTVRDLLTHFPRRYIDLSGTSTIAKAGIGSMLTIAGTVHAVELKRPKRVPLVEITLVDGTGTMIVTCFRQTWLANTFSAGDCIAVAGKVEFGYGFKRMTNPFIEHVEGDDAAQGRVIAVHPATEKISTAWMRRLVSNALELCVGLDDPLPLGLRTRYRLFSRSIALRAIHFPQSMDEVVQARRRLVFEELLLLELHLQQRTCRAALRGDAFAHVVDGQHLAALADAVPFALTAEQTQARDEILGRMASSAPANHLLLGDVGTGKTVVAAFALAAVADSGTQALMMAPTELLAQQYASSLGPLLDAAGVSWALLTGSTSPEERTVIVEKLSGGQLCVLFGTHALLEPDVAPRSCTLLVIDEQQRFGTEQRSSLVAKGVGSADVLSLTATPIPRSLALALYGDMTLSYLRERPKASAGVETFVFPHARRGDAYEIVREELSKGHQAYVVCPLVGTSPPKDEQGDEADAPQVAIDAEGDFDAAEPRAALKEAEILQNQVFAGFEVGVLHGRMASDEKARVMDDFRAGTIDVLVSTTVIEVGIDVPNATAMIVEDADRFGLAQLHQLRGRVGRGDHPGKVCLISRASTQVASERLAAMESTSDGFELATFDLSLRREGDILGNRQHGASVLKLVNVVRDAAVIEQAHAQAGAILSDDPDLSAPEHAALRAELARAFPDDMAGRG